MKKKRKNGKKIDIEISYNSFTPEELLKEIVENYKNSEFSIDIYCLENHVKNSTISTQFTKRYGICPSVFLENLRIEDYLFMLWMPDIKIEEIAAKSGFGSSRRARAVLKKRLSISPTSCHKTFMIDKGNTKVMKFYVELIWNGNRPDELIGDLFEHFDRDIEYFNKLASYIYTK